MTQGHSILVNHFLSCTISGYVGHVGYFIKFLLDIEESGFCLQHTLRNQNGKEKDALGCADLLMVWGFKDGQVTLLIGNTDCILYVKSVNR